MTVGVISLTNFVHELRQRLVQNFVVRDTSLLQVTRMVICLVCPRGSPHIHSTCRWSGNYDAHSKSTVGNYDLTPCLRPSKVGEEGPREPRLSSSLMADKRAYNFRCNWCKTIILLGRLNTTRERNSPTLPYIEYATNYSISLKFITRNFDLI
jgi:hypothetical protein